MALAWNLRRSGVTPRDLSLGTWLIVRVLARLSSVPDVVMVNSEAGRLAHLGIGYHPRRWEVVFNGFDTSLLKRDMDARTAVRDQLRLPSETPVIGHVARYHAAKDHASFIRAAMLIGARHEGVHFVLVGRSITPNNRALAHLIHASGFGHRFHLLGEREDIARLTASFDIACSSSITEGFANTIGEAMACGVPCVATAVGDSAALLGDGGFTVPPGDPVALSEACCRLLAMRPDERANVGARGRARISAEFSLKRAIARYEGIYAELARR
jgi:glycosyltransferase involved in cell wall biosynthesis